MRQPRLKAPKHHPTAFYHCVSRIVNRDFVLLEQEREHFVRLMRMYESLCQVRVITFCVLSNHFHVLVEVPRRPDVPPDESAGLEIIRQAFGKSVAGIVEAELQHLRQIGATAQAEQILDGWRARMWDISAFMKSLKQRFSQWFNKRHKRRGTLWEERYRSTLVEGGTALAMTAAYVDLNPVRAKLVTDPKDYRWCGYAQAVAGVKKARQGIEKAAQAQSSTTRPDVGYVEYYRTLLFTWGTASKARADGSSRGKIREEDYQSVLQAGGKLPVAEALRCRVRYFTDGAVIGGKDFVNAIFRARRSRFGAKRKDGARRLRGVQQDDPAVELHVLRDLQVDVIRPAQG
ncbi:MAG: transposase [Verrucomicrobiaceae bacterium]|nr:transposase [Verrucomicrobiaceae bacterium]